MKALIIGSVGAASAQIADAIPTDGTPASEVVKIVVQLVIGVVSIFHLFRNRKNNNQDG